jgi:Cu/Ag efflux protein CusF
MMQQNKELEISGGRFRKVTAEGYKYLISNDKIRKSIQELHSSSSSYQRVLKELSKITFNGQSYVAAAQAAKQLGVQVGYSEAKFRNLAPLLKSTEVNLTKYGTAQKALIGTTASWVKEVDRAAIVNQALVNSQTGVTKHINLTTKGIKILSLEGMKPFGSLSIETASKLGMLDKSFEKFMTSMKVVQQTTKLSKTEVERLAATFLKSTSSFSAAANAAKDYITKTKDLNKVSQEAKNLTLRYQELATATDKYGVKARSLLSTLEKEPSKLADQDCFGQAELREKQGDCSFQESRD